MASVPGSIQLLVSIGFDFKFDRIESTEGLDVTNDQSKANLLEDLFHEKITIDTEVASLEASIVSSVEAIFADSRGADALITLSEALNITPVMEIYEPVVDTSNSNFQEWIEWFDGLKINSEKLVTFAKSLSQ